MSVRYTGMRDRTTDRPVVEHVVETDGRGNQRIGAREVVADESADPAAEREREHEHESDDGLAPERVSGR